MSEYLHKHCFCQTVDVPKEPNKSGFGGFATVKHRQCCVCGEREVVEEKR